MSLIDDVRKKFSSSELSGNPNYLKYKPFLVPVTVVVFALVISVLVTIPQFINLFNTFRTIDELEVRKNAYRAKVTELEKVDINQYREDLNTALVALPTDKDIPGVLGEILTALGGSGMSLETITFSGGGDDGKKVAEFGVNIRATGSEASLNNFLERVTLTPRLIKLSGIEVTESAGDQVSVSFNFATFYQLLPDGKSAADEALPVITASDTQILSDIEAKLRQFPKTQPGSGSPKGKIDPFKP